MLCDGCPGQLILEKTVLLTGQINLSAGSEEIMKRKDQVNGSDI
jgi:hypothetical protein